MSREDARAGPKMLSFWRRHHCKISVVVGVAVIVAIMGDGAGGKTDDTNSIR